MGGRPGRAAGLKIQRARPASARSPPWHGYGSIVSNRAVPVGPLREDLDAEHYDRLRRRVLWKLPTGLYLLGSRAGESRNLMTLNWAMQVSLDPKYLAVSVEQSAVTTDSSSRGLLLARACRA